MPSCCSPLGATHMDWAGPSKLESNSGPPDSARAAWAVSAKTAARIPTHPRLIATFINFLSLFFFICFLLLTFRNHDELFRPLETLDRSRRNTVYSRATVY